MDHHVCGIEDVVPERDVLYVDEIDDAAVDQSIQHIASPSADDEAETDVLMRFDVAASPQVNHQCADEQQAEQAEDPAMALEHSEDAPHVANVREVNEGAPLHAAAQRNARIDQVAAKLRQDQDAQCNQEEMQHVAGSGQRAPGGLAGFGRAEYHRATPSGTAFPGAASGHNMRLQQTAQSNRRRRLMASSYLFMKCGERHLPPILRGLLGILLILAGMLGFLPVLGFWMIPLGVALLATDIPALRMWFIKRLNHARKRGRPRRGQ